MSKSRFWFYIQCITYNLGLVKWFHIAHQKWLDNYTKEHNNV